MATRQRPIAECDTVVIKDSSGRHCWVPNDKDIDNFIKNEINLAKNCSCEGCQFRRVMYRAIQDKLRMVPKPPKGEKK